jgi:enoyl-CoA hydratase/carnithine racemase
MACDFLVLVEGAELGLTEVRLGIMPGAGGTQRLPRLVGEARAKELILLGRRIPAARAYEIGLVNSVVPRDKLRATVDALLADLALCAPLSVASAKSAIERGHGRSLDEGLQIERECYEVTLFSADRDEGLVAFAEGRPPRYQGR